MASCASAGFDNALAGLEGAPTRRALRARCNGRVLLGGSFKIGHAALTAMGANEKPQVYQAPTERGSPAAKRAKRPIAPPSRSTTDLIRRQ